MSTSLSELRTRFVGEVSATQLAQAAELERAGLAYPGEEPTCAQFTAWIEGQVGATAGQRAGHERYVSPIHSSAWGLRESADLSRVGSLELPETEALEGHSPLGELVDASSGVPFYKRAWAQLGGEERQALGTLGYGEGGYDQVRAGYLSEIPGAFRTRFDGLTESQREAACVLGFDERGWDRERSLRLDILSNEPILDTFMQLVARGGPIRESDARRHLAPKGRKLLNPASAKRALLYLLNFHGHLFTDAASQALRNEINTHRLIHRIIGERNFGWNSSVAPTLHVSEARRHAEGGAAVTNDASGRAATIVREIVQVQEAEDVRSSIARARALGATISIAGRRHSMGAQSSAVGSINLDMLGMHGMDMTDAGTLRVEAGATWAQVASFLSKQVPPLSPMTMQDYDPFTVGGSLSVNVHGRTPGLPPIAGSVRSLRVMNADGEIVHCTKEKNGELFRHVLGGYGLFGVLLDAELEVTPDVPVNLHCELTSEADFPRRFDEVIKSKGVQLAWGRMDPTLESKEVLLHVAREVKEAPENRGFDYERAPWLRAVERWVLALSKKGPWLLEQRWLLEKFMRRKDGIGMRSELLTLNADGLRRMWLNEGKEAGILREYFIPPEKFDEFSDGLREMRKKYGELVGATNRDVQADDVTALRYAKQHSLSFVLYHNEELSEDGDKKSAELTRELIDLAQSCGGSFYLPYRLDYTREQALRSYPELDDFFKTKRRYDPSEVFSSAFYEKYGGSKKFTAERVFTVPPPNLGSSLDDRISDGMLVGAGGRLYPPDTPIEEIDPILPDDGAPADDLVVCINGIMTNADLHFADLRNLANACGVKVIGIRNSTTGFFKDLVHCVRDKGHLGRSAAIETTTDLVYRFLKKGEHAHLVGQSQGAIIMSRGLLAARNRMLLEDGLPPEEVLERLKPVRATSVGGAARRYVDGPEYMHLVNRFDLVPMLLGVGSDSLNPVGHPGEGAHIEFFSTLKKPKRMPKLREGLANYFARFVDRVSHGPQDIYWPELAKREKERRERQNGGKTEGVPERTP